MMPCWFCWVPIMPGWLAIMPCCWDCCCCWPAIVFAGYCWPIMEWPYGCCWLAIVFYIKWSNLWKRRVCSITLTVCYFRLWLYLFPISKKKIHNRYFYLIQRKIKSYHQYLTNTIQHQVNSGNTYHGLYPNSYDLRKLILVVHTAHLKKKQEAHGPHRSPEKTFQINKHIWLYHNVD